MIYVFQVGNRQKLEKNPMTYQLMWNSIRTWILPLCCWIRESEISIIFSRKVKVQSNLDVLW